VQLLGKFQLLEKKGVNMFYSETINPTENLGRRPWSEGDTSDLENQPALGGFSSNPMNLEGSATTSTAPPPSVRFTDYLGILEEDMEPPDPGTFNDLLGSLRRALVHEMRRRALWEAPPRYLGILGGGSWEERELLEELLLDCYEFVFVRRLPGLKKQLMARPNIDGLVFLAIRNFLHEAQKRHDPLGFRVFQMAQSAVLRLLEEGRLHRLGGDARVRCDTVLAFTPWSAPDLCQGVDLRPQVESWNAWLLHDLIAAHHREPVVERLAEAVASLTKEGFEVFRFRDLVEPLKADVRARWQALAPHLNVGEDPTLDAMMLPGADYEARQQFRYLLQCTSQGLDRLEVRKKTKDYLRRLWFFLRQWALEASGPEAPTDRPPSDARLGELLGIPRARLPELRNTLGEVVQSCRRGIFSTKAPQPAGRDGGNGDGHGDGQGSSDGERSTHLDERRDQLRQKTAAVATSWTRSFHLHVEARTSEAQKAQPGDRYVFHHPGAMPVEWLILADSTASGARFRSKGKPIQSHLLMVPVDDNPFLGLSDHVLDDNEATHVRGACEVWVSPKTIVEGVFTGHLENERLRWTRQAQEEKLRASSEQQDVDADPEYQAWQHALNADAAHLGKKPTVGAEIIRPEAFHKRRRSIRWLAMAAGLLAAVGLPFLLRLENPKAPLLVPLSNSHAVSIGDVTRGVDDSILEVVPGQELVVTIGLWRIEQQPWYRMEILQDGVPKWSSGRVAAQEDFLLVLPEDWLPAGYYRLRVYGIGEDGIERLLKENYSGFGSW